MIVNYEQPLILTLSFLREQLIPCFTECSGCSIMNIKLLGRYLTHDLRWEKQTQKMIKWANLDILSLKLLAQYGVPTPYLLRIFLTFVRPLVGYACLIWHYGLTSDQKDYLVRIQYWVLLAVSKSPKVSYCSPLKRFSLSTLLKLHDELCFKFGFAILVNPWLLEILPPPLIIALRANGSCNK